MIPVLVRNSGCCSDTLVVIPIAEIFYQQLIWAEIRVKSDHEDGGGN